MRGLAMISKKKILILSIVIGICSVFTLGCGSKSSSSNKIYLNDYVVVEESGVEGYGIINAWINYEKIMEDYAEKFENIVVWEYEDHEQSDHSSCTCEQCKSIGDCLNCDTCRGEDCGCLLSYSYVYKPHDADPSYDGSGENLCTTYAYTLEESHSHMLKGYLPRFVTEYSLQGRILENAKNGDKIQLRWEERGESVEDLEKILGVKVEYKDFSYEVSKLKKVEKVDPFENVDLNMWGKNGTGSTSNYAYAYVNMGNDVFQKFILSVETPDNNGTLKNGDVLHMKLSTDLDEEKLKIENGIVFSRTEANIEIYGLNAYGQAGASNGKKATININEYVRIRYFYSDFEEKNYIETDFDYDRLIRDYKTSLSENVADEDLFGYDRSKSAAEHIFERKDPFTIMCTSHDYEDNPQIGEVVEFSWEVNEEAIAALKKLMNVEFTYSDFSYTVEDSTEQ